MSPAAGSSGSAASALAQSLCTPSCRTAPPWPRGPTPPASPADPLTPRQPHFAPRAKNVIYLFMAGGPSQLELFDYKPKLAQLNGQQIPEEFIKGKRFAFMSSFNAKERPKMLGTRRKFARHGQAGSYVSECMPHTAGIVDD